jgi:hypothetical protein
MLPAERWLRLRLDPTLRAVRAVIVFMVKPRQARASSESPLIRITTPLPVHLIKMVAAVAFLPATRHPVLAAAVWYVLAFLPGVTIMRIVQSQ